MQDPLYTPRKQIMMETSMETSTVCSACLLSSSLPYCAAGFSTASLQLETNRHTGLLQFYKLTYNSLLCGMHVHSNFLSNKLFLCFLKHSKYPERCRMFENGPWIETSCIVLDICCVYKSSL